MTTIGVTANRQIPSSTQFTAIMRSSSRCSVGVKMPSTIIVQISNIYYIDGSSTKINNSVYGIYFFFLFLLYFYQRTKNTQSQQLGPYFMMRTDQIQIDLVSA
eukprot:scaffold6853_cov50-Attheya_sp.AAC.5